MFELFYGGNWRPMIQVQSSSIRRAEDSDLVADECQSLSNYFWQASFFIKTSAPSHWLRLRLCSQSAQNLIHQQSFHWPYSEIVVSLNLTRFDLKSDKFKILFILLPLLLEFPPVSNLLIWEIKILVQGRRKLGWKFPLSGLIKIQCIFV